MRSAAYVQRGRAFTIVEVDAAGIKSTHIWDRRTTLPQAWLALMRQYCWRYKIGHAYRARGFKAMRWAQLMRDYPREKRPTPKYPATH